MADGHLSKAPSQLLALVVGVIVVSALYFAKIIIIPLALAMLFAFVLSPGVKLLERLRLGRTLSALLIVSLMLVAIGLIGWFVARQFAYVVNELPEYQSNIEEKIDSLRFANNSTLKNASATVNQISKALVSPPSTATAPTKHAPSTSSTPGQGQPLPVEVIKPVGLPVESLQSLLGFLLQILIVIVFTFFVLLHRERLRDRFISLMGRHRLSSTTQALDEAGGRVSRYLRMQLAVNTGYGASIGIGLFLIGIPGALSWGVMAGILRFLPYFGPPLGGIMPLVLSLAIFSGWKMPVITLALFVTVELILSQIIEPMLYRPHTGISPLAILVAAIFWTFLWGPVGLILSTPLTVCLIAFGHYIPHLGFVPLLFGDEPALEPSMVVYQRLLAMDQEEAEQVLESLLKEKPIDEVYDSVLIPALRHAERDRQLDQIDQKTGDFIYRSAKDISYALWERFNNMELGSQNTEAREASTATQKVLCISAGDEAEDIAGNLITKLLERAGQCATSLPGGPTGEILERVKIEKPDVVCISVWAPFGTSNARSLYSALAGQSLKIIVGVWGFNGDATKLRARIGMQADCLLVTRVADAISSICNLERASDLV